MPDAADAPGEPPSLACDSSTFLGTAKEQARACGDVGGASAAISDANMAAPARPKIRRTGGDGASESCDGSNESCDGPSGPDRSSTRPPAQPG